MEEVNVTPDPNDVQSNKVMAILAYFGILFLIPLLAAKESAYARYHTNQGLAGSSPPSDTLLDSYFSSSVLSTQLVGR